jgi:voltage-gated potassium channel Kch
MSFYINDINNLTNAYNGQDNETLRSILSKSVYLTFFNDSCWSVYKKTFYSIIVQKMGYEVAQMIVNYIDNVEEKKKTMEYITALFFKYNKYENGNLMIFNNDMSFTSILNNMLLNGTTTDKIFTLIDEVFCETDDNSVLMETLGRTYNMEVFMYINNKYDLTKEDLQKVVINIITNDEIKTTNNFRTVVDIYTNKRFDFDYQFYINIIVKLNMYKYNELIYIIVVKYLMDIVRETN